MGPDGWPGTGRLTASAPSKDRLAALDALIDKRVADLAPILQDLLADKGSSLGKAGAVELLEHGNTVSVSASHTSATFVLSGPGGCREVIIINGQEITLQANTEVTVDRLQVRPR